MRAMATTFGLDPALFAPESIDAETAAFNAKLSETFAALTPSYELPPQVTRDARESGNGLFGAVVTVPEAQNREIPSASGPVTVRVQVPEKVNAVYLDIHGGGWVFGRAHHGDVANQRISRAANVAVVSVDYRLAPEHPYPAGPDDCEAAAAWLVANAKAEFGTERILIGGGSAGAHLAAVTLLRMRDRHGYTGFAAANMLFGVFDVGQTPSSRSFGERHLVLSTQSMAWFGKHYAEGRDMTDPDVSPLFANLQGMPPALFTVGTLDPLLDDSLYMYSRWVAAGNQAELEVYPGGIHGFTGFPYPLARKANERIDAFIAKHAAG
jgi:acetyl esterase/lipase